MVVGIQTMGQRIYVSDVQESIHFVRHKQHENQLIIFADDLSQRFVTATCLIDYDTLAVADKFGTIAVVDFLIYYVKIPLLKAKTNLLFRD